LKILYHHRTRSRDGQSVHIDEMIAALRREGVAVEIVEPQRVDALKPARKKQVLPKLLYELLEFSYSGIELIKLAAAILRERPDAIYERANIYTLSGVWAARLFSLPLLLEVNAPLAQERGKFDGLAMPSFARWTERAAWRSATYVLPVTAVLADDIEEAGVPPSRIVVTSNGINIEEFRVVPPQARPDLPKQFGPGPVLGFVGYIRAWHGLPQIVDLLAKDADLASANLLVVGDGPGRADLVRRAEQLGVGDRVWVSGLVERDALAGYISSFDIALQPEVTAYASPLKLFEYMALSRAIIAPDAANIREILTHQMDAMLFEPDSSQSLADAIRSLVKDEALRARIGSSAAEKIEKEDISWARNARRAMSLIRSAQAERQKH
ncbi:MAG TPA: glycosyltransferase family 4 protein, partial [Rhizomicrobium sp.]|nr:glycosyltransferase family 4 protein [Rhizomicrobium sp.]